MKKHIIVGSLLITIGIIMFVITMMLCDWDFAKISTTSEYIEKSYSIENTNQNITLRDKDIPVTVKPSDDEKIHFIYYENETNFYDISGTNKVNVTKKTNFKWYQSIFMIDFQNPELIILIPEGYNGVLDLKSNSSITVMDIYAKEIILKNNSKIILENLFNTEDIKVNTSDNKIVANNIKLSGTLECKTNSGGIYLDYIESNNIRATTSDAVISANDIYAKEDISLQNSSGEIKINNIDSDKNINLKTRDNKIVGTIKGFMNDYSITSKTSDGKNNLPENSSGSDKTLNVKNSSGSINIDFTE